MDAIGNYGLLGDCGPIVWGKWGCSVSGQGFLSLERCFLRLIAKRAKLANELPLWVFMLAVCPTRK